MSKAVFAVSSSRRGWLFVIPTMTKATAEPAWSCPDRKSYYLPSMPPGLTGRWFASWHTPSLKLAKGRPRVSEPIEPDLSSPSHEEVDNENDQQHAANATSHHRTPIIVPTTASEKEQQNQNNQDEVHTRILLHSRPSLYRMRGILGLMPHRLPTINRVSSASTETPGFVYRSLLGRFNPAAPGRTCLPDKRGDGWQPAPVWRRRNGGLSNSSSTWHKILDRPHRSTDPNLFLAENPQPSSH